MNKLPDYYKILSVPSDADAEQIKRAYKEKALLYHPDVNPHEKAVEVFQLINLAYRTLIDPELKRKYDLKLKYGQYSNPESSDIRHRHPADANYYRRRQQKMAYSPPKKVNKSIRRLNLFIFYSITGILTVGIIYGMIDLFVNFRFGGLLFSIISLIVIFSGVSIIKKEKSDKAKNF
jgi:curved DNA-binding protein CbpA